MPAWPWFNNTRERVQYLLRVYFILFDQKSSFLLLSVLHLPPQAVLLAPRRPRSRLPRGRRRRPRLWPCPLRLHHHQPHWRYQPTKLSHLASRRWSTPMATTTHPLCKLLRRRPTSPCRWPRRRQRRGVTRQWPPRLQATARPALVDSGWRQHRWPQPHNTIKCRCIRRHHHHPCSSSRLHGQQLLQPGRSARSDPPSRLKNTVVSTHTHKQMITKISRKTN